MKNFISLLISLLLLCITNTSQAHQLSTAYLNGSVDSTGVFKGDWQVRLYDLEQAIGVDIDGDGQLRWQELQSRAQIVTQYLQHHLQISRNNKNCTLAIAENWQVDSHFNEGYLVLPLRAQCPINGVVRINYSAFFDVDSQHKLLLSMSNEKNSSPRILSDTNRSLNLHEGAGSRFATFKEFVTQGVVHIWIGFDHILFLLSLLVSCVLIRKHHYSHDNPNIKEVVVQATWIVTAFTLAHSITLTATALNWIHLPSRWVEVGIAITVALAALNNIFPMVKRLGWLTFGFGLLHGMGFAGALGELGLPADQQALTVLAFNLGVEIGQMFIVILVLPLLILLRKHFLYARYSMTGLSAIIVLLAVQWTLQRI
ncbi:membrane protein [Cellvibrio zantedeschiae]|uniref:Membrane protein n=1 Tax=Cellvibrio zantedeschiae TaxID=1237077 RepID=A0ABQ3B854_9GAMM|nr:HupE/UreJ family protein [Cellvibrio zantedeschiae]GGY82781.1 membrane protein [Cellvibrio zantedeschiae]